MVIEEVAKLNNADRLLYWIAERERVRLSKEEGGPKPWTDDTILQRFRFCNVRRMDDKVSRWLYDNWYKPHFNHPNMLLAAALARFINLPAALKEITGLVFSLRTSSATGKRAWQDDKIIEALRAYRDKGNTVFNGAYMVRGNDGMDKIDCVVNYYVAPLKSLIGNLQVNNMEAAWSQILTSYGFGSFMAGQVVADLRWAMFGSWSDRMSWAPIGPGSKRGMNRFMGREIGAPLPQEKFLDELKQLIALCKLRLSPAITDRLEAHDYQNCLCEYDKYCRVLNNEGKKPKQGYPGV